MTGFRNDLPQLGGGLFLTDGGSETTLIFHRGLDLPLFASFTLLAGEAGREELRRYYDPYLELAAERGTGFVLGSPTWRASPRWAAQLGYSPTALEEANRAAIALMEELRDGAAGSGAGPIVIEGSIGPHGDGYSPEQTLSADEAEDYHATQVGILADTGADQVTAMTITYADEAVGLARAARAAGIPIAISFTVETDGRLPGGQGFGEAIEQVDAETDASAAYYMINCAHPTHFEGAVVEPGAWRERVRGLRANASTLSHAELDAGDPVDLGARYAGLRDSLPNLNVLGGCCGTDHRHVSEIHRAWTAA